jgi:hypothetical protein
VPLLLEAERVTGLDDIVCECGRLYRGNLMDSRLFRYEYLESLDYRTILIPKREDTEGSVVRSILPPVSILG